jgi:hypothetical protein
MLVSMLLMVCMQSSSSVALSADPNNAAGLLEYAATVMPVEVYQFAHNNAFTMLSFAAAILLQV